MNPKVFLVLAAITVVTTAGAVFAVLSQPTTTTLQFVDEPAFPSLRADPDAVAKITLTTPSGNITLVRETGDRWAVLERYGYPVDRSQVRELVVALADMRLIERKTAQPEHYGRLEVEVPDAEDAKSRLVRLEAADGTVLAEAIIGKQRHRLTGTEPSGTYVRRPGEATSWLASGGVQIGEEVTRWLDHEIVDLNERAIERIAIEPVAEAGYVVERDGPGEEWRMGDVAEGEALKEDPDFARLTGALSSLRLEDVKPRNQLSWPAESSLARIRTFDGLEMTVRLAKVDDQYWATFDARAIEPTEGAASAPQAEATSGSADEAQSAPEAGAGSAGDQESEAAASEAAAQGSAGATEPEGTEEVQLEEVDPPPAPAELSRRLDKWAFQIPEHLFNRLTTARSEFVNDQDGTS
jgi:Domain of unknown function (DUF4340)